MKKNQLPREETLTFDEITPTCYHCGEDCDEGVLRHEDKPFCCNGCKTVYQILSENDLEGFYHIEQQPAGVSQKGKEHPRFDFLDDEEIQQQLYDFYDGRIAKVRFHLPQIHCTSCLWLLEKLPVLNEGIVQARVHYMRKEISLSFYLDKISLRQAVELLTELGYEPPIRLQDLENRDEEHRRSATQKKFLYQVGITGFCFGNIMLLSFPEYLGISDIEKTWQTMFGFLNWGLSLPVLLYGASTYWRSAVQAIKHGGLNIDVPITLGIIALFGQSSYEIFTGTGAGYLDSMAALVFFLLVGKWFQQKTFDNISFERDYKSYFPLAATVITPEGEAKTRSLSKLEKGDVIRVRSGELIPADSQLVGGDARIDYSFVTGESEPVRVSEGEIIFAGGRQKGSAIDLRLQKKVSQSYLTQLWNDEAFRKSAAADLQLENLTNRLGQRFTAIVLTIAALTGAYWWLHGTPEEAISNMAAVLIVACPCALALNVPFALGNAMRILARHQFYAKSTEVLERMSRLTHLVFDKTGTLTHAEKAEVEFRGDLTEAQQNAVRALVSQSTHPVSQQILGYLNASPQTHLQGEKIPHPNLSPTGEGLKPATSATAKSLADGSINNFKETAGQGILATINGTTYRLGRAEFVGFPAERMPQKAGLRSTAFLTANGEPLGYFVLHQSVRKGIKSLLKNLKTTFGVSLLSGDNAQEADTFATLFGSREVLHFDQKPQDKLAYIKKLQAEGQHVMMLGDGLNDAGALQQSQVGVAIADNVNQFSPACDVILQSENLPKLPLFLRYARQSLRVVYLGFGISLMYNIVGLGFAVQGYLEPVIAAILMPLSSISVVLTGVLLTTWLGQKLKTQV